MRAIDEAGKNLGEMALEDVFTIAERERLDAIEIAPNANPPVVRIMDFGKFKYAEAKKEREHHPKENVSEVKMVRIGFKTGRHDLERQAKLALEFLVLIPNAALEQDIKSIPQGMTAILKKA